MLLAALPIGRLNAWWNFEACWSNVMFNAINRHEGAGLSWRTPALFAASIAYLFAPFAWYACKRPGALLTELFEPERRALHFAWLAPVAVFALLSPVKTIGLHWLQWFVPAVVLGAALFLERAELERCVRWFAVLAALHAIAAVAVALTPLERWHQARIYSSMVYLAETPQLLVAWDVVGALCTGRRWLFVGRDPLHTRARCRCSGRDLRTRVTTAPDRLAAFAGAT